MKYFFLSIIIISGICIKTFGQNGYYWSQNYGLRGQLLNGAVISGSEDNSSVYYNPASVTNMKEKTRFSLSGIAGTITSFKHTDGAGQGADLSFGRFEVTPNVVAGTFRPFKRHQDVVAYFGVFRRNFHNYDSSTQLEKEIEVLTANPGNEFLSSTFKYTDRYRETWVTIGFAYQFDNNISLGGGLITTFMNRNYTYAWSKTIYDNQDIFNRSTLAFINEDLFFNHNAKFNMLSKLGFSWEKNGYQLGLTFTTPTFLSASDKVKLDYKLSEKLPNDSAILVFNAVDKALKGNFKYPFSAGIGIEIPIKNARLSFSSEYFHQLKPYNLVSPIDDASNNSNGIQNYADWVLNGALGIHINLKNDNIDLLAGFRTDMTSKRNVEANDIFNLRTFNANRYHTSFGVLFHIKENVFSLGLDYGYTPARKDFGLIDLNAVDFNDFDNIESNIASDIRFHILTFNIGYEIFRK